jgi:hypothetical protein
MYSWHRYIVIFENLNKIQPCCPVRKMEEDTELDRGEVIELEEVQDLEQSTQVVYIVDTELGHSAVRALAGR